MFCKNCGKEIDDKALVCPYCGVQVDASKAEVATSSAKEETRVNGLGIAGFAVGLASLGLGVFFVIASIIALGLSIGGMIKRKSCNSCNGLAVAGLVISIISTVLWAFVWIITAALGAAILSL